MTLSFRTGTQRQWCLFMWASAPYNTATAALDTRVRRVCSTAAATTVRSLQLPGERTQRESPLLCCPTGRSPCDSRNRKHLTKVASCSKLSASTEKKKKKKNGLCCFCSGCGQRGMIPPHPRVHLRNRYTSLPLVLHVPPVTLC